MTRAEAARDIDNTACCFSDKRFRDAMHMAAAALRGPQPDPDTGLVPCGCGGKAMYMVWPDEDFPNGTQRYVICGQCMTETSGFNETNENAANRWNTAMGWKGGLEVDDD